MALSRIDLDANGLRIWLQENYSDPKSEELESGPTINLFELWEEGSQLGKVVSGRDYRFPLSLVLPCPKRCCAWRLEWLTT